MGTCVHLERSRSIVANKFGVQARGSLLGSLVDPHITDGSDLLNAIEFMESPSGLDLTLYPVQRVAVKLIFGIPMDWDEREVPVYDQFCENLLYTFKETEYIKYAHDCGRLNVPNWQDANPLGYNEIVMICGRRAGKSAITAATAAYKLYRLLNIHSPQDYYGLVPGSPIDLTMIGTDSESSSRIYDQFKNYANKAPFFSPFIKSMTSGEITFVSEADRGNKDVTPSITVASLPCTTNKARGASNFVLVLDEFAFYRNQIGSNSDAMYEAATPATMQFKAGGTREGKRESMIFIITSPGSKIGKYYTLFKSAMEEGASSPVLAFQCSTAEMNPRSDSPFLKQQHKANPEKFKAEYGGEFLEASESYVKGSVINECVDQDRPNRDCLTMDMIGHKYFWGLDLGMKHDATALAVCHWEGGMNDLRLVYDYVDRKMVGHREYQGFRELPLSDIITWLRSVNDMLPCFKGATDQYGGSMLVQLLHANQVFGMELVHLTGGINSQMYLTFKTLMESRQARFPNNEEFIAELRLLEATFTNKYQVRVAAPEEKGAHDDMGDAAALASYMAQTWALDEGRREIAEIMQGVRQNLAPGEIRGGWDMNASLAHLKSYDRQLRMQMNPYGAVVNPWRKR